MRDASPGKLRRRAAELRQGRRGDGGEEEGRGGETVNTVTQQRRFLSEVTQARCCTLPPAPAGDFDTRQQRPYVSRDNRLLDTVRCGISGQLWSNHRSWSTRGGGSEDNCLITLVNIARLHNSVRGPGHTPLPHQQLSLFRILRTRPILVQSCHPTRTLLPRRCHSCHVLTLPW